MLAAVGIAVCVGAVVAVWVAGALYNAVRSPHSAAHAPRERTRSQLRTHGPYAVTRHPIYTGLLGMLLGATLLSGIGQWIVLFPVGLIVVEVKIRMEEHLMLAAFPEKYPRYRRQVPQLVPGLFVLRQRHSANAYR